MVLWFQSEKRAFLLNERIHEVTQARVTYIPSVPFGIIFRYNALTHVRGHGMRSAYDVQCEKRSEIRAHFPGRY